MARNKGRKPGDAQKPAPETQPARDVPGPRQEGLAPRPEAGTGATNGASSGPGGSPGPRPEPPRPAPPAGAAAPKPETTRTSAGDRPGAGGPSSGPRTGGPGAADAAAGQTTPPPGPPPAGGSSHRALRNGLIGGVVAGAVAALIVSYLLQPEDAEIDALRTQIAELDQELSAAQAGSEAVQQLAERVDALAEAGGAGALDQELAARLEALEAGPSPTDLNSRLEALEAAVAAAADGDGQGLAAGSLSAIEERLTALENREPPEPGTPAEIAELQTRLGALEEQIASLSAGVTAGAVGDDEGAAVDMAAVEALQARLAALEASMPDPGFAAAVTERLDALAARIDEAEKIETEIAAISGEVSGLDQRLAAVTELAGGVSRGIEELRERVDRLEARMTEAEERAATVSDRREQAATLALITAQIDGAISRSEPYEAPLRNLSALAADDPEVQAAADELAPMAASGVPSLAELRGSFESVAPEIVHRARAPEGDSLIDQAAGNLLRLVTVRPVGANAEGDSPAARVARAEAHLAEGDLAAAVAELEALEGPPAEAAADWLARARSRLAAQKALARLHDRTTGLLTAAP